MGSIQKYYDNTESGKTRNNVKYFINEIQCNPGKAIELGCGAKKCINWFRKNETLAYI